MTDAKKLHDDEVQASLRTSAVKRVLIVTLLLNVLVSASKIAYGYAIHSVAIMSDGYHSLFDGISNIVGIAGISLSATPPDETHPYGHRKFETVFTIFIGLMMFLTCIEIFRDVYHSLNTHRTVAVGPESFLVMVATLAVNIFVSTYERRRGRALDSEFLIADSQHTKSDIYATIGVIAGLALTGLGVPFADPMVGAVVGILVARTGVSILLDAVRVLVDSTRVDGNTVNIIACAVDGVQSCHKIRTRGTRSQVFIDLHVQVDPALSVEEGHCIASNVEVSIKSQMPEVVDVVVHVEPCKAAR